jgi:hypothetical protein
LKKNNAIDPKETFMRYIKVRLPVAKGGRVNFHQPLNWHRLFNELSLA